MDNYKLKKKKNKSCDSAKTDKMKEEFICAFIKSVIKELKLKNRPVVKVDDQDSLNIKDSILLNERNDNGTGNSR